MAGQASKADFGQDTFTRIARLYAQARRDGASSWCGFARSSLAPGAPTYLFDTATSVPAATLERLDADLWRLSPNDRRAPLQGELDRCIAAWTGAAIDPIAPITPPLPRTPAPAASRQRPSPWAALRRVLS